MNFYGNLQSVSNGAEEGAFPTITLDAVNLRGCLFRKQYSQDNPRKPSARTKIEPSTLFGEQTLKTYAVQNMPFPNILERVLRY